MNKFWQGLKKIGNFLMEVLEKNQQPKNPKEERWLLTCNCGRHVDQDQVLRRVGGLMKLHEVYLSGPRGYICLCNICNPERGFEPVQLKDNNHG